MPPGEFFIGLHWRLERGKLVPIALGEQLQIRQHGGTLTDLLIGWVAFCVSGRVN